MFPQKKRKNLLNIINNYCIIMQSSHWRRNMPLYECGKIYYDKNSVSIDRRKRNGVIV